MFSFKSMHDFALAYSRWVEESLKTVNKPRDRKWTESIAVGSESFVKATKVKLGFTARRPKIVGDGESYELKESSVPYNAELWHENAALSPQDEYFWGNSFEISE
jgi:putative transposase